MLPTYPFQRQSYWFETTDTPHQTQLLSRGKIFHPLLGQKLNLAGLKHQIRFESQISAKAPAYLSHHQVFGKPLLPAAAYLEMALAAGSTLFQIEGLMLEDVVIQQGLILSEEEAKTVQVILTISETQVYDFQIFSLNLEEAQKEPRWTLHTEGKLRIENLETLPSKANLETWQIQCNQQVSVTNYYQQYHDLGIDYGSSFKVIQQLWRTEGKALGQIQLPQAFVLEADYQIHPILLDASFQVLVAAISTTHFQDIYLPVGVERLRVYRRPSTFLWAQVEIIKEPNSQTLAAEVCLLDADGQLVAIVEGLQAKQATPQALVGNQQEPLQNWLYEVEWRPQVRFSWQLSSKYLPTPAEIHPQLHSQVSSLINQPDLVIYQDFLTQLESLSIDYVLQAFHQLGWQFQLGQLFSTNLIAEQLGVVKQHHRLFSRLLEMLNEVGILRSFEDKWEVLQVPLTANPQEQAHTLVQQYPSALAELTLLKRCGAQLASVLQGNCDPLQLIFPEGDLATVTQLYQDSPGAKIMNHLMQQAISLALEQIPKAQGVRVLEIGAGTGGTTAHILPHLNPAQTKYVFTDVSTLFTINAQEKFRDYPFVSYQTLDIEQNPIEQGFEPHQYDIIVIANALHATADLRQSLQNIRQLLSPKGLLVLLEGTSRQRWLDLIFGLLEGWWRFTDVDLRSNYPLLTTSQWQTLLQESGLQLTANLLSTQEDSKVLSQQVVIVAQAVDVLPPSTLHEPKGWLILVDEQGLGSQLAAQLRAKGEACTLVLPGEGYQQVGEQQFIINPNSSEDFQQIVSKVASCQPALYGVIQCWSLETVESKALSSEELKALCQRECGSTLYLIQALVKVGMVQPPRLWLVTRGCQPIPDLHPAISSVAHSPLWGMGKVIALEHPELKCVRIDLDPGTVRDEAQTLFEEIWSEDTEDQVAFREGIRYVARLIRSRQTRESLRKEQLKISHAQPFRLTISTKGTLENLTLEPTTRRPPSAGEVEIQVKATGLNFLDVVNALGLVPKEVAGVSQEHLLKIDGFGGEFAGEVVSIGEEVQGFEIGDSVIGLAPESFSKYVTVSATLVVSKPENLNFEEAAAIPINFLTAYYALYHVAQISAGDRVLIHAAAGGTGMAAVQIAQQVGAEVFATASSSKWEVLRSMGVQYIMNSRTLDFAEEVMKITRGDGVDIVLNSLTSKEFIAKSLSVVKSQGCFLELAKRDVWNSNLMAEARGDVSYCIIDLLRMSQQQPDLIRSMLLDLMHMFHEGKLQLPPMKVFPIQDVVSAFRYMQQAKHIGKVIVTHSLEQSDSTSERPLTFRGDSTYLITGGLGGLGLLVARWMVDNGARHLVLVGRSGTKDNIRSQLEELQHKGANVIVTQADVSETEAIARVLTDIKQSLPALRGIIHSVGVLDDGVLQQQTWERFAQVLAPKVQGAWNLHNLTQHQPLDFFILFSSVASLLGSPGQASHSAANAFLDALAYHRRAQGLMGLSINWGAIAEIGAAAKRQISQRPNKNGIKAIPPQKVLEALEQLMSSSSVEVGVVPICWSEFINQPSLSPFFSDWKKISELPSLTQTDFLQKLLAAPTNNFRELLSEHICLQVAKVLGINSSQSIDLQQGFFELGMDSLTSVELRNRLQTSLKCSIPSTLAFDYPSVEKLVDYLSHEILGTESLKNSAVGLNKGEEKNDKKVEKTSVNIESLSENELEELINQKLKSLIKEEQSGYDY